MAGAASSMKESEAMPKDWKKLTERLKRKDAKEDDRTARRARHDYLIEGRREASPVGYRVKALDGARR